MELLLGLAGLASGFALTRFSAERRRRQLAAHEAQQILAALASEARHISLLVAVSGSIVNSLAAGRRQELRAALPAYLPPKPLLLPAAAESAIRLDAIATPAIQCLVEFYSLVSFARTATLEHTKRLPNGGCGQTTDTEMLAEAWQAAALQSIKALTILDGQDAAADPASEDTAALRRLIEMLRGVTLGRAPCIRIDGAVIVPGWIERRKQLRREVDRPAQLSVNGIPHEMTLRDISVGGVGLEGHASVKPGDLVNIALDSGVNVQGVAVWNRDGRVGVKLTCPLPNPISSS